MTPRTETADPQPAPRPAPFATMVGAGFVAIMGGIGLGRFAFVALIPAIAASAWFDAAAAGYLQATTLAGYLVGALVADPLARRFGARPLAVASLLAVPAGFLLSAAPGPFVWFALWRFVAGFAGAVLMVVATPTLMRHVAPERRGRATGLIFGGIGIGVIFSGLGLPLLVAEGLGVAFIGLGVLGLALALAGWWLWPRSTPPAPPVTAARPGGNRAMALLLLAYALDAYGYLPHSIFWVDFIARGLGRDLSLGGLHWAIFGLGAVFGPTLGGLLADRIGFDRSLVLAMLLKMVGVALPVWWIGDIGLALSAFLVGAMTPGTTSILSGLALQMVGAERHRAAWGRLTFAFALAQGVFGYLVSFLFAATQSYRLLFAISAAALLVAAVLVWLATRERVSSRP